MLLSGSATARLAHQQSTHYSTPFYHNKTRPQIPPASHNSTCHHNSSDEYLHKLDVALHHFKALLPEVYASCGVLGIQNGGTPH